MVLTIFLVLPLLLGCDLSSDKEDSSRVRPNVVLILIDDMGFNDLGVNGNNAVKTPNLDALAAQGVRFTRHYVDSTCTPTRVGVLTGAEPIRQGFTPDARGISPEVVTLPEALQAAGYSTHHIGKWHVGHTTPLAWPIQQGFDTFFGFLSQFLLKAPYLNGEFNYKRPTYLNPWLQGQNDKPQQYRGHLSEILTDRVIGLIDTKKTADKPWFINFWTYAPHAPVQPMEKFAKRYEDTPAGKYKALLEQVDDTVGRVVDALERNNLAENTLLIVASDNGGTNKQIDNNAPFFGTKGTFLEGGVRTPLIIRWPGKVKPGEVVDNVVSNLDYYPTIAEAAGATLPSGLPGRDLLKVVHEKGDLQRPLFWEASNSKVHGWGVLTAGGKWRMSQYFVGDPILNDLEASPYGDKDVLVDNFLQAQLVHSQYLEWRHKHRRVPVEYHRENNRGYALLSGQSFQRNPGFGGNTFAIGVTPDIVGEGEGAAGANHRQLIADQSGQWYIGLSGKKLIATIAGNTVIGPTLREGECTTVVLASHFVFSALYPDLNKAQIQLYVNSALVDSVVVDKPVMPSGDPLMPTTVGYGEGGQDPFQGTLSRPIIFNERLVPDEESDPRVDNGVSVITDELCI